MPPGTKNLRTGTTWSRSFGARIAEETGGKCAEGKESS